MSKSQTISAKQAQVLEECFDRIFHTDRWKRIGDNYPMVPSVKVKFCSMIDEERGDKETLAEKRSYAHVNHKPNTICVAGDFFDLPLHYQKGILFHEIGHLLTRGGDEHDADKFMFDNFDIEIKYDNILELQYV